MMGFEERSDRESIRFSTLNFRFLPFACSPLIDVGIHIVPGTITTLISHYTDII